MSKFSKKAPIQIGDYVQWDAVNHTSRSGEYIWRPWDPGYGYVVGREAGGMLIIERAHPYANSPPAKIHQDRVKGADA